MAPLRYASWVDELFDEVAADLELPAVRLRDRGQPYEIEDIDNCGWATTLAAPSQAKTSHPPVIETA